MISSGKLSTLFLFLFALGVASKPVHLAGSIPLSRRNPRLRITSQDVFNPEFIDHEIQKIGQKYGAHAADLLNGIGIIAENDIAAVMGNYSLIADVASTPASGQKALTGMVPLQILPMKDYNANGLDLLYYGDLTFGTPVPGTKPQILSVDVDTGSADLWVPSACGNCKSHQFEPSQSSTWQDKHRAFSITYGSGNARGRLGQDRVQIAGLQVANQTFAVVNNESADFANDPNDGLLGLAFGTIARSRSPTIVENLIIAKKIQPFFSIHLTRGMELGSEVCVGCYDATKAVGDPYWIPVRSRTYWAISLDAVVANSARASLVDSAIVAAIDTGTTLAYLPDRIAEQFYGLIKGSSRWGDSALWTFPCDASKNLVVSFTFGQRDFAINQADFNLGRIGEGSDRCVGGVLSLGDNSMPSNLAIIGDVFLKSWYSVYSYENGARVGFAPSVNNR